MATPLEALSFREMFGRHMRRPETGMRQARFITPTPEEGPDSPEFERMARGIWRHLNQILDHGDIFYVSRDITALLLQAARALDPKHIFHFEPEDFPALEGYVYFDGDILLPTMMGDIDRRGHWPTLEQMQKRKPSRDDDWYVGSQPLRGVMWGQLARGNRAGDVPSPGSQVVGKAMYTFVDSTPTERRLTSCQWSTRHWMPIEYGVRRTPSEMPGDFSTWDEQHIHSLLREDFRAANDKVRDDSISLVWSLMYAWMQFMRTELISRHAFDGAGQHNKIMVREGRPPARIRIIALRHYSDHPTENPTEVNWTHRWISRGHWRNQRVGPGRMMVRPTWVRESIKGPADKPLHVPDATIQAYVR